MHGQQRSLHVLAGHHKRDIGFRGALGDGNYIYIFAAQHAEGASGHAHGAAHIFADDGDDGDVGVQGDVFDFLMHQVLRELLAQGVHGAFGVGRKNDKANIVLRRRLRDEQDVRAHVGGGGKRAADDVWQADNSGASNGDERNIANGGERLHAGAGAAALRRDFCAGMFGLESVANPHGNAGLRDGAERLGMQNLGAEVSELRGFAIGDFGNGARAGNKARISGENAVHVGPDDHFIRAERAAKNGGGIVRAAAAECGEHAFGGGADKSGDYGNDSLLQQRTQARFATDSRGIHQRFGGAMIGIGDDQSGGFDAFAADAAFAEGAGNQRRGEAFTEAGNGIERARGEFVDERGAFAEALRFAEQFFDAQGNQISGFGILDEDVQRIEVLFAQDFQQLGGALAVAGLAAGGGFDQAIGDAAHGRNHDDKGADARGFSDNFGDARDAGSVAHRCAAEFHDLQMWLHLG